LINATTATLPGMEAGAQAIQADQDQDGSISATACLVKSHGTPPAIERLQIKGEFQSDHGWSLCVQIAAGSRLFPACIVLEDSGREFSFHNLNAICMKEPVLYVLCLAEPELRHLRRMRLICSFDLKRSLADFRFTSIVPENIL
jgi:hypothetical protein